MPGLSWDSVWFTAENSYPVNAVFYKFTVKVWNGSAAAGYARRHRHCPITLI